MNRMRVVGSKVGIPPLVCGGPRGPKCWKKKAIVSFPTRPDWGAADAAKKRAAFRSPTAPLGRETEGYPAQAQGPGGVGKGFRAPIPWRTPRCLTDRREASPEAGGY